VDFSQQVLVIQPEDSPPLIQRLLANPIDTTRPIESFKYVSSYHFACVEVVLTSV
jgi:hypothetical protein